MACEVNFDGDVSVISVHGREGLMLPYTKYTKTETQREEQVDISQSEIYLEVPKANIRKPLMGNSADPMGLMILLSRSEVETIPTSPVDFVVIDETGEVPNVEWVGKIVRTGYTGEPNGN